MAIILAVDKWRAYLQHQAFTIRTDHRSLLHLTEQRVATKLQHKALLKLMDLYSFSDSLLAISMVVPDRSVKDNYEEDDEASKLLQELKDSNNAIGDFTLKDGLIKFQGKVWLGNNALAQNHVLQAVHSSGVGGHSGSQPPIT
ncbi:LOW QUALITY PROTEIN: hypothetical protein U9M48_030208 [Paspalum notatum var. saurae]|uniref:Reverse transcriptase RNase H-like domain-containing protein n=1 Tax=Paspalum notatum var. saurae TaxID=547442 RepID=A0AAQ3U2J1_PASNO